jgi:hypothetical protein
VEVVLTVWDAGSHIKRAQIGSLDLYQALVFVNSVK